MIRFIYSPETNHHANLASFTPRLVSSRVWSACLACRYISAVRTNRLPHSPTRSVCWPPVNRIVVDFESVSNAEQCRHLAVTAAR